MARFFAGIALPAQVMVFVLLLVLFVSSALAQEVDRFSETRVSVPLYKSVVLDLQGSAARVSIGNPDVADILILRANQLYVLGKDLGTTNVILWDSQDRLVGNVSVEVTHDLESLKEKLHSLLPAEPIEAYSVQRSIVLKGTVSSLAAMQAAMDVADGYLAQIATGTDTQVFEQQEQSKRDDQTVGAVSGELVLSQDKGGDVHEGVGLYWKYEKLIRRKESDADSVVGATGSIYAIRKSLFESLPANTLLDDFLTPMRIVLKGYRVLYGNRFAPPDAGRRHRQQL